jgi:hypothetical protein
VLLLVPNLLLGFFGIPATTEVWVRVVGMLVLILAYYYMTAGRNDLTPMIKATVYGRWSVLIFFIAFVIVEFAPPVLILFGVIDAAAATWTALSLRADAAG